MCSPKEASKIVLTCQLRGLEDAARTDGNTGKPGGIRWIILQRDDSIVVEEFFQNEPYIDGTPDGEKDHGDADYHLTEVQLANVSSNKVDQIVISIGSHFS